LVYSRVFDARYYIPLQVGEEIGELFWNLRPLCFLEEIPLRLEKLKQEIVEAGENKVEK
jgi:hypothetical protein